MKPVKIFYGADNYTKRLLEDKSRTKIEKSFGACELFRFNALTDQKETLLEELLNVSLFSPSKLIILSNADKFLDKEFRQFLKDYALRPEVTSFLILELEAEKLPAALRSFPSAKCAPPYENQMPAWIVSEAASRNIKMSREGAELLFFYCGRDLMLIVSELRKLSAAFPDKKTCTVDDVRSISTSHFKNDIFGYIDALIDGDAERTLRLLENLLRYNTEPLSIVGTLKWKLQQMITSRILMDKGENEATIIRKAGFRPAFIYRGFMKRIERFSLEKLLWLYDELQQTDLNMKSLQVGRELLIEEFSFKFLSC